jgi:NADPH:quinone reductase-like Zn-dependent oxidoreductase
MGKTAEPDINYAVRYDHFGHSDVLYINEVPLPSPNAGEVVVKIKAAGINPIDAKIREGFMAKQFPSTFPSGQGSDFAGIVTYVGDGVARFSTGDEVLGFSAARSSQAEYIAVKADHLVARPANVSWEAAGGLYAVGSTAYAAVRAVNIKSGETLIVSGAAGGVGSLVVQLAKMRSVTVIGLASEQNHKWLRDHGIIPVAYGDDNETIIKAALNGKKADAFIDTAGKGYVELAIELGIPAERINTIADFAAAGKFKVKTDGSAAAGTVEVLEELVKMVSTGDLEIVIAKTYPLKQVKEAYDELAKNHVQGKIILIT